jgi:hypothetical protein
MSAPILTALIEAAMVARRATTESRLIVLMVAEEGVIVKGTHVVGDRSVGASEVLSWSNFEMKPHLLVNSVNLCIDRLARTLEEGANRAEALGFIDRADVPVDRMRRSIHRSHRGEGDNFVD